MNVHVLTGGSEESRGRAGARKVKACVSVKIEPTDESQQRPPSPPATPAHPHPHLSEPMDMSAQAVKQESTHDVETSTRECLDIFCQEVLASGVHSLSDITNRLRAHQVSGPSLTEVH